MKEKLTRDRLPRLYMAPGQHDDGWNAIWFAIESDREAVREEAREEMRKTHYEIGEEVDVKAGHREWQRCYVTLSFCESLTTYPSSSMVRRPPKTREMTREELVSAIVEEMGREYSWMKYVNGDTLLDIANCYNIHTKVPDDN